MSDIAEAKWQLRRTSSGTSLTEAAVQAAGVDVEASSSWLLEGAIYQRCEDCSQAYYPAQPICPACLSERFAWSQDTRLGKITSFTDLHISFNQLYRSGVPWHVGLVEHPERYNFYAFIEDGLIEIGAPVAFFTAPDPIGEAVFIAVKPGATAMQAANRVAARLARLESEFA